MGLRWRALRGPCSLGCARGRLDLAFPGSGNRLTLPPDSTAQAEQSSLVPDPAAPEGTDVDGAEAHDTPDLVDLPSLADTVTPLRRAGK